MKHAVTVVVHTFNPSTWEAEVGRSLWVWDQPGLQSKFQDSQRNTEKSHLEKQNKQTNHATYEQRETEGFFFQIDFVIYLLIGVLHKYVGNQGS